MVVLVRFVPVVGVVESASNGCVGQCFSYRKLIPKYHVLSDRSPSRHHLRGRLDGAGQG